MTTTTTTTTTTTGAEGATGHPQDKGPVKSAVFGRGEQSAFLLRVFWRASDQYRERGNMCTTTTVFVSLPPHLCVFEGEGRNREDAVQSAKENQYPARTHTHTGGQSMDGEGGRMGGREGGAKKEDTSTQGAGNAKQKGRKRGPGVETWTERS